MASRILRAYGLFTDCLKYSNAKNNVALNLFRPNIPLVQTVRDASFFTKRPAKQLWKSVTSVSNAGRRRGRGRGVPRIKDLNRGQIIGYGKVPLILPGLNTNVLKASVVGRHPVDKQQEVVQNTISAPKRIKPTPLERGWSGGKVGGKKFGPPDAVDGEAFEGFESWIVYFKLKSTMTSIFGRVKSIKGISVTGNGNGLIGFAPAQGSNARSVIKTSKNRAGQRLMYIQRYENHTVLHDFFTQFGRTKIFVKKMYKGYGLKCHRIIKVCCEAVGITDLHAKVEGSRNGPHILKAFLIGLLQQKSHQEMANEKKLYLVETRKENDFFPKVVAAPDTVRSNSEVQSNELLDFQQYVMNGRVVLKTKKYSPFYTKLPSWTNYLRKQERRRNHSDVRIRLRAEYGDICSFHAEKYPEARASKWRKTKEVQEE